MYAIIEDSGTQIKLQKGDVVDVDLRSEAEGETVTFDRVLAIGDESGSTAAKIGLPNLSGAKVTAKDLGGSGGPKVLVGKYAGTEVKLNEEIYLLLREEEILAVVE